MKLLWRVTYMSFFKNSSGMKDTSTTSKVESFVATQGDSLSDIVKTIDDSTTCQSQVAKLLHAEYLGAVIVSCN